MTEIVPISDVNPSSYNPRNSDEARLGLIELSLRKLGWLIPIYADESGEILSGHQRHFVASRMGMTVVPVSRVRGLELKHRRSINIAFNRATNDLLQNQNSSELIDELNKLDVVSMAKLVGDIDVESDAFYPCVNALRLLPIKPLLKTNKGRWNRAANSVSRILNYRHITMPTIVDSLGNVINGIGRLEMQAEIGVDEVECVIVDDSRSKLAWALLNLLSMDFDFRKFADLFRHNAYRRAFGRRNHLGRGFTLWCFGDQPSSEIDLRKPEHRRPWIREHGKVVLDFGAGHMDEADILRSWGIDVTAFEPFKLGAMKEVDSSESIRLTQVFLDDVASGKEWSSIFLSSVMQSVPFPEDRVKIITLCAALCGEHTRVYAVASGRNQVGWQRVNGKSYVNVNDNNKSSFALEEEDGTTLGDLGSTPKIMKFYTVSEFREMFRSKFNKVKAFKNRNNVAAMAGEPVFDVNDLRCAIEFEFNLLYPDGTRMGLVDMAMSAFSERIKVQL